MCALLAERISECAPGKSLVWLDHFAYTGRLLAGGKIPWLDAAALAAYYLQAQSLLRSGVAMLPFEGFFDAWLSAQPQLLAEMASRRRVGFALKTLLAADRPRALLAETVHAVRHGLTTTPLVIAIPSPRRWLAWAHARANGVRDVTKVDTRGDDVESAAMYVADFLRTFGESRVDGLLLEEAPGRGPASAEEVGWYQPVINVARHYRWDVGVEALSINWSEPRTREGIDFWITDAKAEGGVIGVVLGDAFWAGEPAPPLSGPGFYFARIPEDAVPERVLARLDTLR
jgi:hypothetical protein